jgi:hypothetical protein
MMQVVDVKALRKLNQRVSELRFADVKSFLEAVKDVSNLGMVKGVSDLLLLPRVKENANMSAILEEIKVLLYAGDFYAASKVAERVLNPPAVVVLPKPDIRRQ